MPGAVKIAVPEANFSVGHRDRKAVCLHLTLGGAQSVRSEFQSPTKRKSAHFFALKTGEIWQFVSILDTAYANGLSWSASPKCWVDPEGNRLLPPHQPAWAGLVVPINPNFQTVSIERELLSTSEHPSAEQDAAVVRILQYVQSQFPSFISSWIPLVSLIGHCHISPIERANCPGPLCDYQALATAANAPVMPLPVVQRYQVVGLPIYEAENLQGELAGHLKDTDTVEINMLYANGAGHLKDGRGFVDMKGLTL